MTGVEEVQKIVMNVRQEFNIPLSKLWWNSVLIDDLKSGARDLIEFGTEIPMLV